MRSKNRSRWVNHWLLTLRQMIICPTSWLRRPVVQNAASLLVGLFMTFMTTSQSNRTWSGKTSQLTPVTRLVLRGLREYDRMEGVSEWLGVSLESTFGFFLTEWSVRNGGTLRESSVWLRRPGIEWRMPDACLTRSSRNMLWSSVFASTPALTSP